MTLRAWLLGLALLALAGCGDDDGISADAGTRDAGSGDAGSPDAGGDDTGSTDAGSPDAGSVDAGSDGGASCLDDHEAGDRIPAGDDCNSCVCQADGSLACTDRVCPLDQNGCSYDGVEHAYGERFPSTDGCNECVCAASGLACTRRTCDGALEEGAILVESLDEPCGDDATFTARAVLDGLPHTEVTAPFLYERDRDPLLYPETASDSTTTVRIHYSGGFAVCRIPNPGQEAFDIEVLLEQTTADGAFDEGFHTYLRRNRGGFTNVWTSLATAGVSELNGSYDPSCLDPRGFTFSATFDADGSARGDISKICETDLLLTVGEWEIPAP